MMKQMDDVNVLYLRVVYPDESFLCSFSSDFVGKLVIESNWKDVTLLFRGTIFSFPIHFHSLFL